MPLPKVKKTLLKFRQPSVEDLVVSDDEVLQETQMTQEEAEKIRPVDQEKKDESMPSTSLGLDLAELTQVSPEEKKMGQKTMDEKKRTLKRKLLGKLTTKEPLKREKKMKTVEDVLDEQDPKDGNNFTVLGLLMVIWFDGILLIMPDMIKMTTMKALRQKHYLCKRALSSMEEGLSKIIQELKHQGIEYEGYSLKDFVRFLQGTEYYTTFTQHWIPQVDAEWIMENLIDAIPEPSSSYLNTTTTSTSSTIAPIATIPADARSCSLSGKKKLELEGDTLEELFQHSSTVSNIGYIQQSIAKRDGDTVITLKSPGECGYRVVKLDVYDYNKICNLPKEQWWKTANYRATFMTSSPVDPLEQMVTKILTTAASNLKNIPGTEKEARVMKSSFSFKGGQQLQ